MPTEFSLFSGLPTELREEIWNLTIRPKYLGVHIFRVYNTNLDHENPPQEVIHFSRNKSCRRERHELDLAVPLAGKELEGTNDPSAKNYLKPEVGYYLSGGAPYYFTIKPMSDSFVLRPDSVYFDLEHIDTALSHGIWNVSIEYQSEWGPKNYDEGHNGGDYYNLKRKANAPPYRNGLFYAGDRKLIELDFLGEDSRNHWEYIEPVPDGDYEKSSFEFVEQLHAYYEEAREDGPEAFFTLL
ncbi:2EXR domain [Fusarium oxysporum f. sp. vasinfectum]|nr:2EXR domain [Fusarium oxysporum f. sp. vasinfectum]